MNGFAALDIHPHRRYVVDIGGRTVKPLPPTYKFRSIPALIGLYTKFGSDPDRAYGAKKIRLFLAEQGAQYTIPPTKNLLHPWKYDRQTYKRRNVIERCFCRLKDFRRISTRYDKRADSFQAFLFLAASAVIFSILHI